MTDSQTESAGGILETDAGPGCRQFSVLDAMILIAGIGATLALARELTAEELVRARLETTDAPRLHALAAVWARVAFKFVWVLLLVSSLTFLVVRLRRPRPAWKRLIRQPGMIAAPRRVERTSASWR